MERFWSKVEKTASCWIWTAAHIPGGYGSFSLRGNPQLGAHRVAWELTYGPIPRDMFVLHRCDRKDCVNPSHLYLGTQAQNARDAAAHGLYPTAEAHWTHRKPDQVKRGSANGWAKLTEATVHLIRALHAQGMTNREIARATHTVPSNVAHILHGRTWSHLR